MIISKTRKFILIFIPGIFLQSCVTDGIPEGGILDHYLDGCSKKIDGILVPIRCPINESPIWSTDQRLDSLERFQDFFDSPKRETALQMSMQRKQDKSETYYNTEGFQSYGDPMTMMSGKKFIVQLYFRNYSLFPNKYANHETFRTDEYSNREIFLSEASQEFTRKWTDKIFTRYLGESYERFEPQLGIVHDRWVGVRLLVNGLSELEAVIYRDPIWSVRHIGDPNAELEEILVTQ